MKRSYLVLICLSILAVSLWLRLSDLDSFLTSDENLWAIRSTQFAAALRTGDWGATAITGHPGVTTMWAGSLGLAAKWLFAGSPHSASLRDTIDALAANPVRLDYLPWLRLPIALFCTIALIVLYLLARQVMAESVALLAAGLLTFDPFLLAHGRLLQMDGLLTMAIAVAWLALLTAFRTEQRRFLIISGLSIGTALLTKSPALVMGPLILGAIIWARLRLGGRTRVRWRRIFLDLLWTGIPVLAIVFVLWPALWVRPLDTFGRVWGLMTAYGGGEHELGNYWLGMPTSEPGILFYPAILALRTTPVTLVGLLLALAWSITRPNGALSGGFSERALWAFVLWFGIVLSLGAKKFDRYLLPIFPALDMLAAWGWVAALEWTAAWLRGRRDVWNRAAPIVLRAGALLLLSVQAWGALANRPSYLTAYNPLAGGIRAAARTVLVGWGEGLAEAAKYLNGGPDVGTGRAAAWYGKNVFGAFYQGESHDLYYDTPIAADLYTHDVDWVVTYINQEQRGLLDPSVRALLGAPLYSVTREGVTLATVFAWPKPFAHTSDLIVGDGLRLLGWQVGDHDRAAGMLPVTLYWDAAELAAIPRRRVLVWMKDASGEVWAAEEATIPADSGAHLATRIIGWLGQPAVPQSFMLRPPIGLRSGVYRIEIAPLAGAPTQLTALQISPTRLSEAAALDPNIQTSSSDIRFGDVIRLIGFELAATNESWLLDLIWVWLAPLEEPYHYFIHAVDTADQIVAQQDGPLVESDGLGELARQRIHLNLPGSASGAVSRVYVGLYRPRDGVRATLTVDGQPAPDGRYLLTTYP